MMGWIRRWAGSTAMAACVTFTAMAQAQGMPQGVAFVPDPPPKIDGTLDRFFTLPGWLSLDQPGQVVFGKHLWKDASDLSGRAILTWDTDYLYVAVQVADDKVVQPFFASEIWKGDHVILMLDLPRQVAGSRSNTKVWQIGLSPGADGKTPELYQWRPTPGPIQGARVASRKTDDGYAIEAAIPWRALGVQRPEAGLSFGADIIPSDADQDPPTQEKLVSLLTSPWKLRDPDRLVEFMLAPSTGKIDPSLIRSSFIEVADDVRVAQGKAHALTLDADQSKDVKEVVIRARLDTPKISGGTQALEVYVNGQVLDAQRIRNRLAHFTMGSRQLGSRSTRGWFVFYAPSYKPADAFSTYSVREINPYEFRFDVTGLWKEGQPNVIEIRHTGPQGIDRDLVVTAGVSQQLSPKMMPPPRRPAPTGELPVIEPLPAGKPAYTYQLTQDGGLAVTLDGKTWQVDSSFSTLQPGWAKLGGEAARDSWQSLRVQGDSAQAASQHFTVQRTVTRHDTHLTVTDTLTNLSDDDLPVMVVHQAAAGDDVKLITIAGLPITAQRFSVHNGGHPASAAYTDKGGLALLSEDDLTRAQAYQFIEPGHIGLRNQNLVVAKGKSVELAFSIYPVEQPDPFLLINRIRAAWDVNFTIDGSFAFTMPRTPLLDMSVENLRAYLQDKSVRYASLGIPLRPQGGWAHGAAVFGNSNLPQMQKLIAMIKEADPDVKRLVYYHCFISNAPSDPHVFADAILRKPDGSAGDYRSDIYPLFVPRQGNTFAQVQDKLIDYRFDVIGVDGIYWDELEYSAYKYDYSTEYWDGVSGQIDPRTHKLARRINNVTLATQSWRLAKVKQILARGPLVGNGAPSTRTMMQQHFPRFAETGSITNLTNVQLYTPIALGDHLTERTALDAYRQMVLGLDYGALYYWYNDRVMPNGKTLTEHMFPATPVRLGKGYHLAKERILTNTSGLFGWGDDAQFDAYVYDDTGKLTDKVKVNRIMRDGKAYAEVRIAQGYSVAIVRK